MGTKAQAQSQMALAARYQGKDSPEFAEARVSWKEACAEEAAVKLARSLDDIPTDRRNALIEKMQCIMSGN